MTSLKIGDFSIDRVPDIDAQTIDPARSFPSLTSTQLDGYAKALGHTMVTPDLDLVLSFHTWVVRRAGEIFLIDSCIGNDKERPLRPYWHRRSSDFLERLARLGIQPTDVTAVLCTHLHADHVGWNTRLVNGHWVPTFPNARYVMCDIELEHCRRRLATEGASLMHGAYADSVLPVIDSGQAEIVAANAILGPGVHLEHAPGHTPGTVLIHLESGGAQGVCTGDVLHHPLQLDCPEMTTGYCDDPVAAARTRVALCERLADTSKLVLTAHFPAPSAGTIGRAGRRFRFDFANG